MFGEIAITRKEGVSVDGMITDVLHALLTVKMNLLAKEKLFIGKTTSYHPMNKSDITTTRANQAYYNKRNNGNGESTRVKTVDPVKAERRKQLEFHKNLKTYPVEGDLW